ncbi:MAG TPA: hypothetical protein QF703_01265 [Candidatus Thalassarchaeaceae archaeon]|nr:hypothetical protein [Candidatus Thalassarchaeaceae archaeon]
MLLRQRIGVILMISFLPINGPLWRMLWEVSGHPIPISELYFFGMSILLFVSGTIMAMSPNQNTVHKR